MIVTVLKQTKYLSRTADAETSGRQHAIDARTLLTAASEVEARSVNARRHSALLAVYENKVGAESREENVDNVLK